MKWDNIIKTPNIYTLYLLPFLLAGVFLLRYFLGSSPLSCCDPGLIDFSFMEGYQTKPGLLIAGGGMILLLSYLLFIVSGQYRFLSVNTTLTAIIYTFLATGVLLNYGVTSYLASAFLLLWAIARLQAAIVYTKSNAPLFDLGFLVMLSVLCTPKLLMLIPWVFVVLPFSGRATFKDLMALFIGLLTPVVLLSGYYFYTDQWEGISKLLPGYIWNDDSGGVIFMMFFRNHLVELMILLVLIICSVFRILFHTSAMNVAQRRGLLSMLSLTLFLGSSIFFIPLTCYGFFYVFFIPLTYIYSYFFSTARSGWTRNLLFVLFLLACSFILLGGRGKIFPPGITGTSLGSSVVKPQQFSTVAFVEHTPFIYLMPVDKGCDHLV